MEVHCLDLLPICHVHIYKFTETAAPLLVTLSRILCCMIECQVTSKLPHPMEASFLGNFLLLGIAAFNFILVHHVHWGRPMFWQLGNITVEVVVSNLSVLKYAKKFWERNWDFFRIKKPQNFEVLVLKTNWMNSRLTGTTETTWKNQNYHDTPASNLTIRLKGSNFWTQGWPMP